mmetsp:Transcript_17027/g.35798  ORF Transcript_17027/g.35798 Transcript_17027/m.35798 type:complete len:236 (-) Transcript_17027:991-1698(-)
MQPQCLDEPKCRILHVVPLPIAPHTQLIATQRIAWVRTLCRRQKVSRQTQVIRSQVLHPHVQQRNVTPRVLILRRAERRQSLVRLVAHGEGTPEPYPALGAAGVQSRRPAEVPLRQVVPPAGVVVTPDGEPGQRVLGVGIDQSMRELKQPALQPQSHQRSDVDVPGGAAEGIYGVDGRAVRERTAEVVRGMGAYRRVGEDVRGFAEGVTGGEGAECLVNGMTDGGSGFVGKWIGG